jgi:DNA-binding transcriptional LysR family regulator
MKFRHLEYFVAAAEELNFTHAAGRLHVSQPPFSKQIHDLEGELGIEFFERQRKGVALTPAGKSFLIDARRILEDCETSIRKAQRISRGEIGELAIGYISAMTHDFLGARKCRSSKLIDITRSNLSPSHAEHRTTRTCQKPRR